MAVYPNSAATDADLLVANDNAHTTLAEALDASETDVDVTSAALFLENQVISVGTEKMLIESIVSNTLTVQRGYNSTATTHSNGDAVRGLFTEDHHNVVTAEIIAIENALLNFFDLANFPNLLISAAADGNVTINADGAGEMIFNAASQFTLNSDGDIDFSPGSGIINAQGSIIDTSDNFNLGSTGHPWQAVYAGDVGITASLFQITDVDMSIIGRDGKYIRLVGGTDTTTGVQVMNEQKLYLSGDIAGVDGPGDTYFMSDADGAIIVHPASGQSVNVFGDINPGADATYDIGSDGAEFDSVHTKELHGDSSGSNLRIISKNGGNIVLAPDNDTHVDSGDFYVDNSGSIFMNNSGSQILGVQDGTPIYSAEAVSGNGLGFTSGNGSPAMYIGGARAWLAANAGTDPATSYEPMYFTNGGNNAIEQQQHTNSVSTSPTLISAIDHSAHSWLVWGKNGSARFLDRVYVLEGSTVMSAICVEEGTPAARTYTSAGQGGGLSVQMASGTYTVVVWGNHLE